MRSIVIVFATLMLLAPAARAGTVDPPLKTKVAKLDRAELNGVITSFDDAGFELMDYQKQKQTIRWEELSPDNIMNLHARLIQKGTPEQWFNLGKKLLTLPGGRPPADRA